MSEVKIKTIIPLYEARVISYRPIPDSEPREMRVAEGWAAIIEDGAETYSATIYYDQHGLYRGFVDLATGTFEFAWSPHNDVIDDPEKRDVPWDMDQEVKFLFEQHLESTKAAA